jgi:hypothetical protein
MPHIPPQLCFLAFLAALLPSLANAYDGLIFHKERDSCYECRPGRGGPAQVSPPTPAGQPEFDMGVEFFESGDFARALPYLQDAVSRAPQNMQYQRWLAGCLSRLGRHVESNQVLNALLAWPNLSIEDRSRISLEIDNNDAVLRKQALESSLRDLDARAQASALDKASRTMELVRAHKEIDAIAYRSEAERIFRGIRRIEVPPPIPAEEVKIKIGQLGPSDDGAIERWGERGLALLDMVAEVKGGPGIALKVTVVAAHGLFADLDGAQVYVAGKTAHYEKALSYLKNPGTREAFVDITRRLRDRRPLPENASIDMARAVEAISDPRLHNTSAALVWDAMMSQEAKNAALTRLGIEAALQVVGGATKEAVQKEMIAHDKAASQAVDFLSHAKVALGRTSDPVARKSLTRGIALANRIIARTYRTAEPAVRGMVGIEAYFAETELEAGRRVK